MRGLLLSWGVCIIVLSTGVLKGEAVESFSPSLEERLIRLEEGQKSLDKRFDDFQAYVDKRFEHVDKRFDDLMFWIQMIFTALLVVIAGLVTQWLVIWKRLIRVEMSLREIEKDSILGMYRREIERLEQRMARLETRPSGTG